MKKKASLVQCIFYCAEREMQRLIQSKDSKGIEYMSQYSCQMDFIGHKARMIYNQNSQDHTNNRIEYMIRLYI